MKTIKNEGRSTDCPFPKKEGKVKTMSKFTVNGKEYTAKPIDFNFMCDLEDMGISMADAAEKPMSMVRAYFGVCTGKGKEYAGKELEQHILNGGQMDVVINAMNEQIEKSDFFRSLTQRAETEDAKNQKEKK